MMSSCLTCHHSVAIRNGLVCAFHDRAQVRAGFVCSAWILSGGQGSFYGVIGSGQSSAPSPYNSRGLRDNLSFTAPKISQCEI